MKVDFFFSDIVFLLPKTGLGTGRAGRRQRTINVSCSIPRYGHVAKSFEDGEKERCLLKPRLKEDRRKFGTAQRSFIRRRQTFGRKRRSPSTCQ